MKEMKKTFSRIVAVLFAVLMAVCFVLQTGTVTFADETVDYKGKYILYHDASHDGVGEGIRVEDGETLGYGPGTLVITCDYADNEPDPQRDSIKGHICEYYPQLLVTVNAVYDYEYTYISDRYTFEYLRGNTSDLYWGASELFANRESTDQWKYMGINGTEYPESEWKPSKPGTYEVRAPWKVEDKTYTITRHVTISPRGATLLAGPGIFAKEVKTGKAALWLDGTPWEVITYDGYGDRTAKYGKMTVKQDSEQKELPLDTILFASPAEGGKDSGALGKEALKKVEACENSTWKITCKDRDGRRSSFKAELVSYGKYGNSVTVRYSNAAVGETEYVSAVIKNSSGEVTYYGRLAKIDSADTSNGEIEIDLTDRIENGDKLYIFSEQYNGEKATDYAGELQEIPLLTKPEFSVTSHHITAGEDEMLEVSLPEDATGTVTLTVSDRKGSQATYTLRSSEQEGDRDGELVQGKGTVRIENPGAGRHIVTAVYSGDENYYEKNAETAFVVSGADSSVTAGTEVFRNPVFAGNAPVVYFGKDSERTAYAWYAVGYDGEGAVPQEGCVTLLAYGNIAHSYFNESQQDNNRYAESSLRNTIEGLAGRFNTAEKAAIVKRTLQSGNYNGRNTDCVKGRIVEDAVLWPLSTKEAYSIFAVNKGILATDPRLSPDALREKWWLRSPGYSTGAFYDDDPMNNHFAAGVSNFGNVDEKGFSVSDCCYGVRPAFYLNRNSVLLTSAAEGGKSSFEDGKLSEVGENTSGAWRLTLLDDGSADAVGNGHRNFAIDAAGVIYDEDTKEVTIPYTGATAGKNEYISAVIKNGEQIKAYGRIAKASAAAGAAVRVRLDRLEKGDALYVFNEQYNGDRKTDGDTVTQAETDYASGLKRVPVASPYWTGSGTEEAPFVISDQKGWEDLAELVDNGFKTEDVFFTLDEDINSSVMVGKKDHPFEGVLDGGGHILQADIKTDASSAAAPFGVIKDAEIRNLIVKGTVEGGRHSAGLVVSTYGQCIITACDVHTAVTAPDYCGGIIGHGTESETTVEGCVFRGSLTGTAAGGANAGGIWGWSDPGAKPTIVNCLEAGSYTNVKLNPIGIGKSQNGGDVQTTYHTTGILGSPAESWNAYGSPVHTLTADEGIVPGFDTEKKTEYKAIGLLVSDCGALTDGVVYAPENATVTITLPSVCDDCKLQPETVERKGELPNYTITMPKENVTVKLKEGANHSWKFSGFQWKGSSKDGYTAEAALYVCEHDGKHRERVSKVTVTSKVTAPTSTAAGHTTYLASVSAKDSLDGQAHKESKTGKPVPKRGIDRAKAKISLDAGIKGTSSKGNVTAKWGKVKDADSYDVFAAYCEGNSKYKKIKTVSGKTNKFVIKKLAGKKLNSKRNVKYYVVAYKTIDGKKVKLARSLNVHVVGSANKGWTNIKSIKVTKKAYTLKKGKTAKIKAMLVLYQKGKKTLDHERKFRYATSNDKVATVSKKGKIKAVGKGKCEIYVYAQNGCAKKIKVTVK